MPRLPQVSGRALAALLHALGYEMVRQRGSHAQFRKRTEAGDHRITVPLHDVLAKGTLNDILTRVSVWNAVPKEELLRRLRGGR